MPGLNLIAVALPGNLREDLAWQDTLHKVSALGVSPLTVKAPGEFAIYPTALVVNLSTDANVVNRLLFYFATNPDGGTALSVGSPVTQPASTLFAYTLNLGSAATYSVSGNISMFLPSYLLLPGWSMGIAVSGMQAGDQITLDLSMIKIPTGPALAGSAGVGLGSPLRLTG